MPSQQFDLKKNHWLSQYKNGTERKIETRQATNLSSVFFLSKDSLSFHEIFGMLNLFFALLLPPAETPCKKQYNE